MKLPNFRRWASGLVHGQIYNRLLNYIPLIRVHDVERALKTAFEEGRALGNKEGYKKGLDYGWQIEQDKQYAKEDKKA